MKIAILGAGYVGLCTGIGFAMKGHDVTCVDVDAERVELINRGKVPFFEHGLQENLRKYLRKKTFRASRTIGGPDIVFICVGTPENAQGAIDLSYVKEAAQAAGAAAATSNCLVVVKSTVVPGTTESVIIPLLERAAGKPVGFRCLGAALCGGGGGSAPGSERRMALAGRNHLAD